MRFILPFSATAMLATPSVPYVDVSELPKLLVSPDSLSSNQGNNDNWNAVKRDKKCYGRAENNSRILH